MGKKNPYKDMKFDDKGQRQKIRQSFDSTIGQANNQAALAGAVQGVANTGRASADTYANVASERDRSAAAVDAQEIEFDQWRKGQEAEWDANNAGFWDYLSFGAKLLQGVTPFASALGIFDSFLGKKPKSGMKATPSMYPPPQVNDKIGGEPNIEAGEPGLLEFNTNSNTPPVDNRVQPSQPPGAQGISNQGRAGAFRPLPSILGGRRNNYLGTFNRW